VSRADLVYLSTTRLQDQLHAIGVLPARPDATWVGAIASASDPLEPLTAAATSDGLSPVFGYMASSSHRPDLALALPGIEAVLRNDPTARFEIYGSLAMPAPLCERFGPRVRHHAAVADYDAFLGGLRDLGWSWGIAPLRPGRFNEAKTDTKWVEYAAARIPCLASQHAVYADCLSDGAAVGVSDAEWEAALPRALADTRLRTETLERSRRRLSARHNLARMTSQLQDVFRRVGVAPDLLSLPTLTSG
jgi:glycosyltransferase involved in cell wall biosynthesis